MGAVSALTLDGTRAPLRCKSWKCQDCGPWLRRRLKKAIIHAAEDRPGMRRFFTLTMGSKWHGAGRQLTLEERKAAHVETNRCFRAFVKRRERATGRRWAYVAVREAHKDGTPHVHGLMDGFVSQRDFRADWVAVGGGHQVKIEYVHVQHVAKYLSKYLVKDGVPLPKGCRHYGSGGGVKLVDVRPAAANPGAVQVQVFKQLGDHWEDGAWKTVPPKDVFVRTGTWLGNKFRAELSQSLAVYRQRAAWETLAVALSTCSCNGGAEPLAGCCRV